MDRDEIDNALHEISMMLTVALGATDPLLRSEAGPAFFHMPAADAKMLSFALFDLHKRVGELKAGIYAPNPGLQRCA